MNARTSFDSAPRQELTWQWPLDASTYDQTPELRPGERAALSAIIQRIERSSVHWLRIALERPSLRRLLQPIEDVFTLIQVSDIVYPSSMAALLFETHRRRISFWGWTSEDWVALLNTQANDDPSLQNYVYRGKQPLVALAYLLCNFNDLHLIEQFQSRALAQKVFGDTLIDSASERLEHVLRSWGYRLTNPDFVRAIPHILLANRSPYLEDLTLEALKNIQQCFLSSSYAQFTVTISEGLVGLGILSTPLESAAKQRIPVHMGSMFTNVADEWIEWSKRWKNTTTLQAKSRDRIFREIVMAGRWLFLHHPEITNPTQWTHEIAAEYVAAVIRSTVGEWSSQPTMHDSTKVGKPLAARSISCRIFSIRMFFRDCQYWQWLPYTFNPLAYLATPRSVQAMIGPNPRVISDDIWAKLLWAGLNLANEDLPGFGDGGGAIERAPTYPLELVRAVVIVWLFTGLRKNEILRLQLDCVRWQREDVPIPGTDEILPKDSVCLLTVPVNKTRAAFTKPVDYVVGEAIRAWQHVRPQQPPVVDYKTGDIVEILFSYRGHQLGQQYINRTLIPMLCQKAGVPRHNARGNITSHWARSTIATQLYNAKEPMTLAELQAWLGHRSPLTTQHYVSITPTKLAKAYADAGYFGRNVRTIEVLIDQEAVLNGDAAHGLPWKYYDLGHGYCTYDFFDQCEHRMACAHCKFYRPKNAFLFLLEEKKQHLLHMKQDIPLTDVELAAVEGDLEATEKLIAQLMDVPTPEGPTPRQLGVDKTGSED